PSAHARRVGELLARARLLPGASARSRRGAHHGARARARDGRGARAAGRRAPGAPARTAGQADAHTWMARAPARPRAGGAHRERAAGGRVLPRGGRAAARERSRRGPGAVGTGDDAAGVSAVDVAGAAGSIVQDARGQALDRRLLKMSELAERSGVSPGTIRYYLREGLLGAGRDIVRTSRNMAYYPPEYVERIALIKRLQQQRF